MYRSNGREATAPWSRSRGLHLLKQTIIYIISITRVIEGKPNSMPYDSYCSRKKLVQAGIIFLQPEGAGFDLT